MMARIGGFVALGCLIAAVSACGNTTKNKADSSGSETGTEGTTGPGGTSGSGGASTQSVTAVGSTGSGTGTGGTTSSLCPSFEPAIGSSCAEADQVCIFENCQPPDYNDRHQLTCINGAWDISAISSCQAGACPDAPPLPDSACDAGFTPGPCSFTDACGASHEVLCVQGLWKSVDAEEDRAAPPDSDAPEAPLCPAYPPYLGDPCCPTSVPEVCDYTQSTTDGAAGASFLIAPADTGGGAAEPPPSLYCAVCTPEMTWNFCPVE